MSTEFHLVGDYIAAGGFGSVRFSTSILHELVRTPMHNLGLSGHCTPHDFQQLAAGKAIDRCDITYVVGMEMRAYSDSNLSRGYWIISN